MVATSFELRVQKYLSIVIENLQEEFRFQKSWNVLSKIKKSDIEIKEIDSEVFGFYIVQSLSYVKVMSSGVIRKADDNEIILEGEVTCEETSSLQYFFPIIFTLCSVVFSIANQDGIYLLFAVLFDAFYMLAIKRDKELLKKQFITSLKNAMNKT